MYRDRAAVHPVLGQHRPDLIRVDLGQWYRVTDSNLPSALSTYLDLITHPSSLLPLHSDGRRLLVEPDPETLQFVGQNSEIIQWFEHVEDDEDEVAGSGNGDDLTTTTFAIFGSFDNTCGSATSAQKRGIKRTWQIQDLYSGAVVLESTRNGGEGGELVAGDFGMCAPDCQRTYHRAEVRHTSIWTSAWISPIPLALL
jgi:hypothetical protein